MNRLARPSFHQKRVNRADINTKLKRTISRKVNFIILFKYEINVEIIV